MMKKLYSQNQMPHPRGVVSLSNPHLNHKFRSSHTYIFFVAKKALLSPSPIPITWSRYRCTIIMINEEDIMHLSKLGPTTPWIGDLTALTSKIGPRGVALDFFFFKGGAGAAKICMVTIASHGAFWKSL